MKWWNGLADQPRQMHDHIQETGKFIADSA